MKKNIYVSPKMEMMDMNMACDILTMSATDSLPETKPGDPEDEEEGLPADANERVEWGNLW